MFEKVVNPNRRRRCEETFPRNPSFPSVGRVRVRVSRLARNSTGWHCWLEKCALTNTLNLDEDSIYDPALCNDRLVLGLKGTMSKAELHVIRARLGAAS
jgi:hypothetical protein